MGKTFKFKTKNVADHTPSKSEVEDLNWKRTKAKMKQSTKKVTDKDVEGHFNQQHIWPTTNTKDKSKRGRKI